MSDFFKFRLTTIERSTYDGTQRETLFQDNQTRITGLALNISGNHSLFERVFFVGRRQKIIFKACAMSAWR